MMECRVCGTKSAMYTFKRFFTKDAIENLNEMREKEPDQGHALNPDSGLSIKSDPYSEMRAYPTLNAEAGVCSPECLTALQMNTLVAASNGIGMVLARIVSGPEQQNPSSIVVPR